MTKTKKNLIDYLYADNGGIVFCSGDVFNQVGFAKSAKVAAYVMETKGIADEIRHSSSMDFASEYGFKRNQDARILFGEASTIVLQREADEERLRRKMNRAIIDGVI